jgi:hypothetical protein
MKGIQLYDGKNVRMLAYTGRVNYKEAYEMNNRYPNVGTIGHVDHSRHTYSILPELVDWNNGLVRVGGRIIHDLRVKEEVQPEHMIINPRRVSVMNELYMQSAHTDIGKSVFFQDQRLLEDRRSVIPTKQQIAIDIIYNRRLKQMQAMRNAVVVKYDEEQIQELLNGQGIKDGT